MAAHPTPVVVWNTKVGRCRFVACASTVGFGEPRCNLLNVAVHNLLDIILALAKRGTQNCNGNMVTNVKQSQVHPMPSWKWDGQVLTIPSLLVAKNAFYSVPLLKRDSVDTCDSSVRLNWSTQKGIIRKLDIPYQLSGKMRVPRSGSRIAWGSTRVYRAPVGLHPVASP